MSILKRLAIAAVMALGSALPAAAQEGSLTISSSISHLAAASDEVPDPRAGYNGWVYNQAGVTENADGH